MQRSADLNSCRVEVTDVRIGYRLNTTRFVLEKLATICTASLTGAFALINRAPLRPHAHRQ